MNDQPCGWKLKISPSGGRVNPTPLLRSVNAGPRPGERAALTGTERRRKIHPYAPVRGAHRTRKGGGAAGACPRAPWLPENGRPDRLSLPDAETADLPLHPPLRGGPLFPQELAFSRRTERMERMRQALEVTGLSGRRRSIPRPGTPAERRMVAVLAFSLSRPGGRSPAAG